MALVLVTPPAVEPLTVAEAKAQSHVLHSAEDGLIAIYLQAAREWAEGFTGRAFVTQTWDLIQDAFPYGAIRIPKPPVQSITSVQYVNGDGVVTAVESGDYVFSAYDFPGSVRPVYSQEWPTPRDEPGAVRIRFVAGYGLAVAVPASIKAAILLQAADLYANRERQFVGTIVTENPAAKDLLAQYRYVEVPK